MIYFVTFIRIFSGDLGTIQLYTNPDFSDIIDESVFEDPDDTQDTYSTRMKGFFVPSENSDYTFYIRGDDKTALYLSSDENPANKVGTKKVQEGRCLGNSTFVLYLNQIVASAQISLLGHDWVIVVKIILCNVYFLQMMFLDKPASQH